MLDLVFYVIFAAVVGSFAYRFLRHGGIRGILYGTSVRRTVGEIDLMAYKSGTHKLRVHVLENHQVAIEESHKQFLGGSMNAVTLEKAEVVQLIDMLEKAQR